MFTESQVKSHLRSRKGIIADWHILLLYLDSVGQESIEVYGLISNLIQIIVDNKDNIIIKEFIIYGRQS